MFKKMGNYIAIFIVIAFFIGMPLLLFLIEKITKIVKSIKLRRSYKSIVAIPSGEILQISEHELDKFINKNVKWNSRISHWTVKDDSFLAKRLRNGNG